MARMLVLAVPAVLILAACGAPSARYDSAYRSGYNDGYRTAYGDRYGYSSYGYNDRAAYRAYDGSRSRYRNLQRPSDY